MKYVERTIIGLFFMIAVVGVAQAVNAWFAANDWKTLSASDWASWVQAVGSVVAISAGFVVASRQTKAAAFLAYRERVEHDVDRLTAAFIIAMHANDIADEAIRGFGTRVEASEFLEFGSYELDFQGALDALRSVPIHELRSVRMVKGILAMRRYVDRIQKIIEHSRADSNFDTHDYYEIRDIIIEISQIKAAAYDGIVQATDEARARLTDIGWVNNEAAPRR